MKFKPKLSRACAFAYYIVLSATLIGTYFRLKYTCTFMTFTINFYAFTVCIEGIISEGQDIVLPSTKEESSSK